MRARSDVARNVTVSIGAPLASHAVATVVVEASRTQWRTFRASVTSGLVRRDATLFLSFSGQCDVDYFLFTAEGGKQAG